MPSASIHHRHRVRSDRSNTNANANCRFGPVSGDGEVVRPPPSLLCCCCDCADDCLSFIHQGLSMAEKIQLFSTGCLLANPSESEGSSTVPSNFCSQMAARRPLPSLLLSSLLFHETHSFLRWCCSGGPSFLPSFRTAAAAMDFSLGAHFIKNRST